MGEVNKDDQPGLEIRVQRSPGTMVKATLLEQPLDADDTVTVRYGDGAKEEGVHLDKTEVENRKTHVSLSDYGVKLAKVWTLSQVKGRTQVVLEKLYARQQKLMQEMAEMKIKLTKAEAENQQLTNGEVNNNLSASNHTDAVPNMCFQTADSAEPTQVEKPTKGEEKSSEAAPDDTTTKGAAASLGTAEGIAEPSEVRTLLEKWGIQNATEKARLLCENGWDDIDVWAEPVQTNRYSRFDESIYNYLSDFGFTEDDIKNFKAGVKIHRS